MINCSHELARGFRSMIHCPVIIFLKNAIYNVFDTISPLIFTFYTRNSDYLSHVNLKGSRACSPEIFLCDGNLVSFGDVLLRDRYTTGYTTSVLP